MRLLYVPSGHPLQEADDCLMWDKLGLEWFSTGYYSFGTKPGDLPEIHSPIIPKDIGFHDEMMGTRATDHPNTLCGVKNKVWTGLKANNTVTLSTEFLSRWDYILFSHFPENILNNLGRINLKKTRVAIKTYGMHTSTQETQIKSLMKHGCKVIRNSPVEHLKYGHKYAGHDAVIRGSVVKDEHDISGWIGDQSEICTFSSFFYHKDTPTRTRAEYYEQIKNKIEYPMTVYGVGSDIFISHEEKLDVLRRNKVNLVVGTPSSNNTYSLVEALVMGQPVVVFGPSMWQSKNCEVPNIVKDTALICESPQEAVRQINVLMENRDFAEELGKKARARGIELFGRDNLAEQWREFLCI